MTGHNQRFLFGVMPTIVAMLAYWIVGSVYLLLDFTGWLSKYKVQPGKNQPPSSVGLSKAVKVVLVNQLVVGAPLALLAVEAARWAKGCEIHPEVLRVVPSPSTFVFAMIFNFTCREVFFYYSHK
jgi:fatty acid hydroxylase domain-containing protein 2